MDREKYFNPFRKLEKHFNILVNGGKVKILKYKIISHMDAKLKQEYKTVELITKVSDDKLNSKRAEIIIQSDDRTIKLTGTFYGIQSQPGLKRYFYKIVD